MSDLEQIVNRETKKRKLHKWLTKTNFQRKIKNWLVDSAAINAFYTPTLAFNELVIAGMSGYETLKARTIGIPLGFILGRPFGKFREFYAKYIFKTNENSTKTRKFLADTTASLVFNAPVYASILTASGASFREIAIGLPSYAILNTVLARPYGWFLDQFRKPFGIRPTLDHY